ncbi:hypothetical protein GMES_4431 [Paraglaciecola mesophila KMM 241]|jgi:hypothetical protein|uniref:Uncharacterized protein n=1 Tax=Paraglaciecola mesophila KMM 241 TaxID=1128912 RepID=K6Z8I4_9ALTE|nr:hypothetical protein GMES_4431 [Paraglaciecola mesophila KMM 241]
MAALATTSLLLILCDSNFPAQSIGLSDGQTGTSGQGVLLYRDVSSRRSDIKAVTFSG